MNTLIEELKRLSTEATDGPWMSGDRGVYTANAVLILKAVGSAKPADMDLVECFRNNLPAIIARLEAAEWMLEALLVSLTRAFTQGYQRGHEATCEGGFACIVPEDEKSYFIEDMQLAFDEGCFPELLKSLAAFDAAGKEVV